MLAGWGSLPWLLTLCLSLWEWPRLRGFADRLCLFFTPSLEGYFCPTVSLSVEVPWLLYFFCSSYFCIRTVCLIKLSTVRMGLIRLIISCSMSRGILSKLSSSRTGHSSGGNWAQKLLCSVLDFSFLEILRQKRLKPNFLPLSLAFVHGKGLVLSETWPSSHTETARFCTKDLDSTGPFWPFLVTSGAAGGSRGSWVHASGKHWQDWQWETGAAFSLAKSANSAQLSMLTRYVTRAGVARLSSDRTLLFSWGVVLVMK